MRDVAPPNRFRGKFDERPLTLVLVGFALGYVAALWIQGRGRLGRTADDKASAEAPSP